MAWTQNAVWKVLQSQSYHRGVVSTLTSPRLSCESSAICPSITIEGAPSPYICMTWMRDAVWKVIQPQSYHSGVVSALTSPRVSASSPKSGETSVLVMVWVCSHMPNHHNWRCSNTLYAYDTWAVLPLWNLTPSLTHFPHEASSCNHNHHPPKHTAHVWHHPRLQKRGSCLSNPKSHSQTIHSSFVPIDSFSP